MQHLRGRLVHGLVARIRRGRSHGLVRVDLRLHHVGGRRVRYGRRRRRSRHLLRLGLAVRAAGVEVRLFGIRLGTARRKDMDEELGRKRY